MKKLKTLKLDAYEKQILADFDAGKFESVPNMEQEIRRHAEIARYTLAKTKTINIRISERDLIKVKASALREGLSYQTFITSVLHKTVA